MFLTAPKLIRNIVFWSDCFRVFKPNRLMISSTVSGFSLFFSDPLDLPPIHKQRDNHSITEQCRQEKCSHPSDHVPLCSPASGFFLLQFVAEPLILTLVIVQEGFSRVNRTELSGELKIPFAEIQVQLSVDTSDFLENILCQCFSGG